MVDPGVDAWGQEAPWSEGEAPPAAEAAFDFGDPGLLVSAENSPVPSEGEPLKVSFVVWNTGSGGGYTDVTVWVDGVDTGLYWTSPWLEPGQYASPEDGYIHDVPAQTAGRHVFEVRAAPAGPGGGSTTNEVDISSF